MNNRERLLDMVGSVPTLNSAALATDKLEFPKLKLDPTSKSRRTRMARDVTTENFESYTGSSMAIDRLFYAIKKASGKLEFSRTPLYVWRSTLIFEGDKVRRDSSNKRFIFDTSKQRTWSRGDIINKSRDSLNNWFIHHLMPMLKSGGSLRHSCAIIGSPGSGKSTIIKYLMSEHSEKLKQNKIILSRFEFLKFWKDWKPGSTNIDDALTDYISFIHSRDLVLDYFFDFVDGCRHEMKLNFRLEKNLNAEIDELQQSIDDLIHSLGYTPSDATNFLIHNTISNAAQGNQSLMNWLRELPTDTRFLLIGALWKEKCLVTIYDGLDSLRIEDAFQDSEEWKAVMYIIQNRQTLSVPTRLRRIGIAEQANSIVVMRNNTAAILEYLLSSSEAHLDIENFFELGNLDGLTSMLGVIQRAANILIDLNSLSEEKKEEFIFEFMKVIQRTMIAIWRGNGPFAKSHHVYDFFDGNLRDLFDFLAKSVVWTVRQMLASNFLDTKDYYQTDTYELISAISSERGVSFLSQKSYRIVELILFDEGAWFENAASTKQTKSLFLKDNDNGKKIIRNNDYTGHIDNIFNYIDNEDKKSIDSHSFLEKIRIMQVCRDNFISDYELKDKMIAVFGYTCSDLPMTILFLLKTNFLEARIIRSDTQYDVKLTTTTRGILCISSLLRNLSYIEHVFHKTLLPSALISHVEDKPRESDSLMWAVHSIRNAFILLTYFNQLEENPASGIPVPDEYRLYGGIQQSIVKSLERMTRPGAPPQGALERIHRDANWICNQAVDQISITLSSWRNKGLLAHK